MVQGHEKLASERKDMYTRRGHCSRRTPESVLQDFFDSFPVRRNDKRERYDETKPGCAESRSHFQLLFQLCGRCHVGIRTAASPHHHGCAYIDEVCLFDTQLFGQLFLHSCRHVVQRLHHPIASHRLGRRVEALFLGRIEELFGWSAFARFDI